MKVFSNFRMQFYPIFTVFILLAILGSVSCVKEKSIEEIVSENYSSTPYEFEIPLYFPTELNIPDDNPMTIEGIELGRYLFYDGRISGRTNVDSLMSCATCHIQKNSFEVGLNHPLYSNGRPYGLTGIHTPHTMLPMVNLVWNQNGYLWSGYADDIESVVSMTVVAPNEISGSPEKTVDLIQSIKIYPPMFNEAFGTETVSMDLISKAIAQFVRTLVSSNSKFDKYLRGEVQLSEIEREGFELFTTEEGADCFHCHGSSASPLFTTNLFYNNAKDSVFNDLYDRYGVTGDVADIGAYKAPTLRNIALTAPYMHDGRFKTLDEVLDFYNFGLVQSASAHPLMHKIYEGGMELLPAQLVSLKAFLLALSDSSFVSNDAFSNPFPGNIYFIQN